MDDLIKQLQAKTGLGVDQISSVLEGVSDFLGDKLPEPIAGQVRRLLGGAAGAGAGGGGGAAPGGDLMDQAKDLLGGFLGGDKK